MATYIRPRFGAIALGALCALGAAGILLEDIRHSGEITIDHGLSLIVIAGTIAAGHFAVGEARRWRLPTAAALALLFGVGSVFCVSTTAGRTAALSQSMTAAADAANEGRKLLLAELAQAKMQLGLAQTQVGVECKTGFGPKCTAWQGRERAYQALIRETGDKLAKLPPDRIGDMKLQNTAAVLAALTGGDRARIEPALGLILPLIPALFLELGSILFLGIGLGHGTQAKAKSGMVAPITPPTDGGQRTSKAEAEAQVVNLLRFRKGKLPTQGELARLWRVDQSTVSRWCADWNRRGITDRQRAVG